MRPILFCSWNLSQHEKWMPPSPNWDGLPVCRLFQNDVLNKRNYVFAYNSASSIDRDEILVSTPIFLEMMSTMMTPINCYDSWLTQNSKCLSLKPAKITFSAIF